MITEKACTKCGVVKPLDGFYKKKHHKYGVAGPCIECEKLRWQQRYARDSEIFKRRSAEWLRANPERARATQKAYEAKNRDAIRLTKQAWRDRNHDKLREYQTAWMRKKRQDDPASERAIAAALRKRHPERYNAYATKRRAIKLCAQPPWANKEKMLSIYWLATQLTKISGEDWHVDHIVPLQSKLVCGLHCEANLQVLPASINRSKNNRVWPDMP